MREKQYPQLIAVDPMKIKFNERNPRRHQGAEFHRLKESVRELGVVQLPTVRVMAGGFYECIDGEGRVKAAQEAGLPTISVVCFGIVDDMEALTMLQAANAVRSFGYLAGCKGLANLHRQGQTSESIARNLGVSRRIVQTDISVGYFPERTLTLIQQDILQSDEVDGEGKRTLSWSAKTFAALLPLRVQIKERGDAATYDDLYDYTEVHRAVEEIIRGEITTHEQLQRYVEQRRRELFEERFDKALQIRLKAELAKAQQALEEAHAQQLQNIQKEMSRSYEAQIDQLQQQLKSLDKRHQEIVREVAKRPELIAKREQELQQKLQETEEERIRLQSFQQQVQQEEELKRQQLEQEMKKQAENDLRERQAAMEHTLAQTRADLETYYAHKDRERQIRAEKTIRQAIAHGTELLAQTQQWLLLLISPAMATGLTWLQDPEVVSLLAQIKTVRETLERAEEVILHGRVSDSVPSEGSALHEYR